MSKATDIRLVEVSSETEQFNYRTPIKFGGRVVDDVVLLHVTAAVETRDGRRGKGFGSMPVGNIWAWPSSTTGADQSLEAMTVLGKNLASGANDYKGMGHPLEITHDLAAGYQSAADRVTDEMGIETMPKLAQLVSASPLEAAIHDAYGKTLGENSYNLLSSDFANRDIASYLVDEFAGEYLDQYTSRQPKPKNASLPPDRCARPLDRR